MEKNLVVLDLFCARVESMHITPEIPAYAAVFFGVPAWRNGKYYAGVSRQNRINWLLAQILFNYANVIFSVIVRFLKMFYSRITLTFRDFYSTTRLKNIKLFSGLDTSSARSSLYSQHVRGFPNLTTSIIYLNHIYTTNTGWSKTCAPS